MDHAELVTEMLQVERLSTQDRLHLARMRRAQQLKVAKQREKEWIKQQNRKGSTNNIGKNNNRRHIAFEDSVVLLEAAARNDINEVRFGIVMNISIRMRGHFKDIQLLISFFRFFVALNLFIHKRLDDYYKRVFHRTQQMKMV